MRGRLCWVLAAVCAIAAPAGPARADDAKTAAGGVAANTAFVDQSIALLGLDALGIDEERVQRLEALFRMELGRLARKPLPSARQIAARLKGTKLGDCSGETRCLTAIGKRLGVDLVVTGNVASLGDSYVVNIKVVDAAAGSEIRRISSDPLRGEPDELIEPIRVAAYRLLAPERLKGAISVLADIKGARVELDGTYVGMTPLGRAINGLAVGPHRLRVAAKGYSEFNETVEVRFQKTSRVVARLVTPAPANGSAPVTTTPAPDRDRWYTSPWFYVAVGVTALVVGGIVGSQLGGADIIDCSMSPEECMP